MVLLQVVELMCAKEWLDLDMYVGNKLIHSHNKGVFNVMFKWLRGVQISKICTLCNKCYLFLLNTLLFQVCMCCGWAVEIWGFVSSHTSFVKLQNTHPSLHSALYALHIHSTQQIQAIGERYKLYCSC